MFVETFRTLRTGNASLSGHISTCDVRRSWRGCVDVFARTASASLCVTAISGPFVATKGLPGGTVPLIERSTLSIGMRSPKWTLWWLGPSRRPAPPTTLPQLLHLRHVVVGVLETRWPLTRDRRTILRRPLSRWCGVGYEENRRPRLPSRLRLKTSSPHAADVRSLHRRTNDHRCVGHESSDLSRSALGSGDLHLPNYGGAPLHQYMAFWTHATHQGSAVPHLPTRAFP